MSYAGVPLTLVATSAYNSALILEKRALEQMPSIDFRRPLDFALSLLASPEWFGGFVLILVGLGCQFVVLSIEPLTIAQPLLAGGVAIVLVLSRVVLRERLGGGELWCLVALAVSVVLLSMSAGPGGAGRYASVMLVLAVALPSVFLALAIYRTAARAAGHRRRVRLRHRADVRGRRARHQGTVGDLRPEQVTGPPAIAAAESPYLYMLGCCARAGFGLFQAALQRCRASIVVPVNNIAGSVYFVVAGSWLFHEHLPTDPVRLALRLGGILAGASVLILLPKQASASTSPRPRRPPPPLPTPGVTRAPV